MTKRLILGLVIGLAVTTAPAPLAQQDECRVPLPAPSRDPNIFSFAQENHLGDAVAERYESSLRLIEDEALTAHLRRIGDRLVRHLPPHELNIAFHLIDYPDANAFVLPGGRVYVSRKLVALSESEDELANVIGHELGHLVARQMTQAMTKRLKDVLGVTEVTDRADILAKYNRLMDNAARKPDADSGRSHGRDQLEADRIGALVVAAAGYDPNAHVALFDRVAETKGSTGSALSRFFGTTSPEAKRLGELIKGVPKLPPACTAAPVQNDVFQAWRLAVVSATTAGRRESVVGKVGETALGAFRGELADLAFSPDGRHLLARDSAGVTVLTRSPLAVAFRIPGSEGLSAQFTPASDAVVLHTPDLRVERWSVALRRLTDVKELYRKSICFASALSPDGNVLACNDEAELSLIDVASGQVLFRRKDFYRFTFMDLFAAALSGSMAGAEGGLRLRFSPDGRFFVAAFRGYQTNGVLAYDLAQKSVLSLKNDVKKLLTTSFAFVGPDRVIGLDADDPSKSGAFTLSTGVIAERFALPIASIDAPTRGDVLFVRPHGKFAAGIFDLKTKQVTKGTETPALDAYGDEYAAEHGAGGLALFAVSDNAIRAGVELPATSLSSMRAGAISADLEWVAVSERKRGILWNTTTGETIGPLRAFNGAFIDAGGLLFADMPRLGLETRAVARLDGPRRQIGRILEIPEEPSTQVRQSGRWISITRGLPAGTMSPTGVLVEMRDLTRKPEALWKVPYEKFPPHHVYADAASDSVVVTWHAEYPEGRERIRINPELRSVAKLGDIEGDHVVEILDALTGTVRKRLLIETGKGSFDINNAIVSGDMLLLIDDLGRVLVYALSTGELRGHVFGSDPVFNTKAGILVVSAGGGRLVTYDLATLARRDHMTFAEDVSLKALSADGDQLLVLTADQKAHRVNLRRPVD